MPRTRYKQHFDIANIQSHWFTILTVFRVPGMQGSASQNIEQIAEDFSYFFGFKNSVLSKESSKNVVKLSQDSSFVIISA